MGDGISRETSALFGWLGSGQLDDRLILAAIQETSQEARPACSSAELLELLRDRPGTAARNLSAHLRAVRRLEALKCHQGKKSGEADLSRYGRMLGDLPLGIQTGWRTLAGGLEGLRTALRLLPDRLLAETLREKTPKIAAHVSSRFDEAASLAAGAVDPLGTVETLEGRPEASGLLPLLAGLKDRLPEEPDEDAAADALAKSFSATGDPEEQRRALDRACSWPTSRMAPVIRRMGQAARWQERASLLLTLRFGEVTVTDWNGWASWLTRAETQDRESLQARMALAQERPAEVLLVWALSRPDRAAGVVQPLAALLAAHGGQATLRSFAGRYAPMISAAEWQTLGQEAPPAPAPSPKPAAPRGLPRRERPAPPPPQPAEKAADEDSFSLWNEHILPFLTANWSMVAGILMVVAGSSVLAYYTWDKHWLIRYTLLPALLGGFTAVLAAIGARLERYRAGLKGTADLLRGAAIALLPANFMAVALMVRDPQVTHKLLVLPAFALLYFVLSWRGLSLWCSAVEPALGDLLAAPLLLLNGLILLGPASQLAGALGLGPRPVVEAGFYLGFLAMAGAVVRFTGSAASPSFSREERVPWFFGLALAGTFAQVFLWVHGFLRDLPRAHVYAPMVVAAGGLVLLVERRSSALRKEGAALGKESFIGYALILLGLCMGAADPAARLVTLVSAGAVWLGQAVARQDERHAWIAFTLLVLGGASVMTWGGFPGPWAAAWTLALALAAGGCGLLARRWWAGLAPVGARMQALLLGFAAAAAVLGQWRWGSEPAATAAVLAATAAAFAWRARRDDDVRYVHAAMTVLALALPYAGFADMSGRTQTGNELCFGLSLLSAAWLALTALRRTPLLLAARSGVVVMYGALAAAAMIVRVLFEQGRPGDAFPLHIAMSLGGPVLMGACLLFAAFFSRSLLPTAVAVLLTVIVMPELKTALLERLPFLTWGMGIGSGFFAAACAAACFPLRSWALLKDLEGGDTYDGRIPFPWLRRDRTLFTWPLAACAVWLAAKVGVVNLAMNWTGSGVRPHTAVGLVLAGAAWLLLAVYSRGESPRAKAAVHLGWLSGAAGLALGYTGSAAQPRWDLALLLAGLYLNGLYAVFHVWLAAGRDWAEDLLAAPLRQVLRATALLSSCAVLGWLLSGASVARLWPLMLFSSVQLAWFGLADGEAAFGVFLFLQTWAGLAAWGVPGTEPLLDRLSPASAAGPTLLLFLAVQALYVVFESAPRARERVRTLTAPCFFLASLGAALAGMWGCLDALGPRALTPPLHWLLFAAVLAAARAQDSGPIALVGFLLGYLGLLSPELAGLAGPLQRLELAASPWRAAALALAASILLRLGEKARERWPRAMSGYLCQGFFKLPAAPFLRGTALALSVFAVLRHGVEPALRGDAVQLWAPYLSAAALAVAGSSARRLPWFVLACLALAAGNIHAARLFLGDPLRARGLMENHLLGLGVSATLIQLWLARALARRDETRAFLDRACLAGAGFVLVLLLGTYFVHPDLERMSRTRFVASGLMALLAGRCFWRAARRPDDAEARHAALWEGLYHVSLVTAFWCAALLVPWFRSPNAALPALALPVVYFYLRAELASASAPAATFRYLRTAAALSFFILALYAFRGSFQLLMFPGVPVGGGHYHFNAPFIMVLALLMLRLHGLGGTSWLAFYGGLALIGGSYFCLTALPGMSPFSHPAASAWCAVGLGHFWLLGSSQPSPLKAFAQRLACIDEPHWLSLRSSWGLCLLAATQGCLLWGMFGPGALPRGAAPLLLGGASLLAHQAVLRGSPALLAAGILEALAALHAGFAAESWLPPDLAVWGVLVLWAGLLAVSILRPRGLLRGVMGPLSTALWLIALAHVFRFHPGSVAGLGAFAGAALLLALAPRASREPLSSKESLEAVLLLAAPAWLVYFARAGTAGPRPEGVLLAAAALLLTAGFARWFQARMGPAWAQRQDEEPRAYDQLLSLLASQGARVESVLLPLVFALTAGTQALLYGRALSPRELGLMLALYGGSAYAWLQAGLGTGTAAPYVLFQLCCLGFAAAVRRQLMLAWGGWNYAYDVWIGLGLSLCLSSADRLVAKEARGARGPFLASLLGLPAAVLTWAVVHGLGSDTVLLVLGLYSLMFAYMGRDDRESPYHLLSVGGAVAFVLVAFWTKLELRVVQAYVIPVGMGTLVLLQLFRDSIAARTRNEIRAVTLLSMLGSAGWYALLDDRYPAAFHLTFLLLSLLSMGLGSLVRARLYLFLGFAGLAADLLALLCKMLVNMERGARMTLIGGQVLFLGAALIFGAIYYRTHQEEVRQSLGRWRERLSAWE